QYNAIGELAKDSAGGLDTVIWTTYNKIRSIKKHNGDSLVFFYNPMGSRLEKRYYPYGATADTTKYSVDVSGKILAIYDRKKDTVRLTEWDIYGAKRIGSLDTVIRIHKPSTGVGSIDSITYYYLEGQKQYELVNHLGNVLVTISDKKIPVDTVSTDTLAKYYLPLVVTASDYYPFGMVQPGRTYLLSGDSAYRFAFNGKEKTNEIYGPADAYDYGKRFYDPRIGRPVSIDPLASKFPFLSPYQFFSDNPIMNIDLDGKEGQSGVTGTPAQVNNEATGNQTTAKDNVQGANKQPLKDMSQAKQQPAQQGTQPQPTVVKADNRPDAVRNQEQAQGEMNHQIADYKEKMQGAYPIESGGGDFGCGSSQGIWDAVKCAPGVVVPEIAADYIWGEAAATTPTIINNPGVTVG
ncbi:MAG TPA: RHS repeat-associated core domain-containing protein, partial [Bacteroidia bacterium]|nr:RHS repeat-associated core domain-containing protein [Bacteroidia bacterium]